MVRRRAQKRGRKASYEGINDILWMWLGSMWKNIRRLSMIIIRRT